MARVTRERFDAVLLDLDGVITDTARTHASCWKQVFDPVLERWALDHGEIYRPFDADAEYRAHVDGKSRLDGVRDLLAFRGIEVPEGDPDGPRDADTVHGIAQRKDALVTRAIENGEVAAYPGSVRWLQMLRRDGYRTALVSSSRHAGQVIEAVGLAACFDARVDGETIDRRSLPGKPAPDAFLEAARALRVEPSRAVVVEDAEVGVQAGRAGGFGLVIGVARHEDEKALVEAGADLVVSDLEELLP